MKIKTPSNLYMMWNIGSNLGMFMIMQIISGIMISSSYFYLNMNMFINSTNIMMNVNYGWMMRMIHSNITSLIFMMMMTHMHRNLKFMTFKNMKMWNVGMMMYLLIMMISFIGYSLVWNQMSFWAMMVISKFFMILPKINSFIMKWMWGNYFIDNILINRFFTLHFLMPMTLSMLMIIHIMNLHKSKSSNPLGMKNKIDQTNLSPTHMIKDTSILLMILIMFYNMIMKNLMMFSNPDNMNKMNYFKTPNHIEPEWYFLMMYSILRSMQTKISGMLMMLMFILSWMLMPLIMKTTINQTNKFNKTNFKMMNMMFLNTAMISFMGTKIMEFPYESMSKMLLMFHFLIIMMFLTMKKQNLSWK